LKIKYDKEKLEESIEAGAYDERNLAISKSGKHRFPSKLMFIRFLEQFPDIKATADIWSHQDHTKGEVTIHVEVKYKVPNLKEAIS